MILLQTPSAYIYLNATQVFTKKKNHFREKSFIEWRKLGCILDPKFDMAFVHVFVTSATGSGIFDFVTRESLI